jgi:small conductance mechanosensitive channel
MPSRYLTLAVIVLLFVAAIVIVRVARALVHRMLGDLEGLSAERRAEVHDRTRRLVSTLGWLVYALAAAASLSIGLSEFGVGSGAWNVRTLGTWFLTHGVNVVAIVLGATFVVRVANLAIEHFQGRMARDRAGADLEWQRRASTLSGLLMHLVRTTVSFLAILMLLRELSFDVVPILTGAGIAGLAIGFGAQNLVRDVISGFFIILEDQVRIGDVARINNVSGSVEEIKLRTIVLRDDHGAVQVFPSGAITSLANLSKEFSFATVEVRVAYTENIDRVIGSLAEVGAAMQADPRWAPFILAPLDVLGVESIADGAATIRAKFKTPPLTQGKVANELRKRVLAAMVKRGIRPYSAP